nr:uncharacterized protein LOC111513424 isoform X1 [Leptinotarsa decemlineata]
MSTFKNEYLYPNYKRFDFGVPLEDIFSINDIHPRLKYLLQQAYTKSKNINFNIGRLLGDFKVPLEECLKLKEILVSEVHYKSYRFDQPETYFWLIRHFLGLLPISLLPKYAGGFVFDWEVLAKNSKNIICYDRRNQDEKKLLDYLIAKSLNNLPAQHLLLFSVLIIFFLKVSQRLVKPYGLNRQTLLSLLQYYCGSIFTRPYRPGYGESKDKVMIHFLLYVTVRWNKIQKYLGSNGSFTFIDNTSIDNELFTPRTSLNQHYTPWVQAKKYLKDVYSQTEEKKCKTSEGAITDVVEHTVFDSLDIDQNENISGEITDLPENSFYVTANQDEVFQSEHSIDSANPADVVDNEKRDVEDDRNHISFPSSLDTSNQIEWKDVIDETDATIKKVDGYMYDDYDTFKDEEYNQISDNKKNTSKLRDMFQTVWMHSTPKRPLHHQSEVKTVRSDIIPHDTSYFKFPGIFSGETESLKNLMYVLDDNKNEIGVSPGTSRSYNNSKECLCSSRKPEFPNEYKNKGSKDKTNFNLKRFKMKLHFLRVFSSDTTANLTGGFRLGSNVRYKKFNEMKSFTL